MSSAFWLMSTSLNVRLRACMRGSDVHDCYTDAPGLPTNAFHRYHLVNNTWEDLSATLFAGFDDSAPVARSAFGFAACAEKLYLFGGQTGGITTPGASISDPHKFDTRSRNANKRCEAWKIDRKNSAFESNFNGGRRVCLVSLGNELEASSARLGGTLYC